jgi:hypothetical protein
MAGGRDTRESGGGADERGGKGAVGSYVDGGGMSKLSYKRRSPLLLQLVGGADFKTRPPSASAYRHHVDSIISLGRAGGPLGWLLGKTAAHISHHISDFQIRSAIVHRQRSGEEKLC